MQPIRFEGYESILGAPVGWNEAEQGPCEGLPIIRMDGACVSVWKPTLVERLRIMFGENIQLHVVSGVTQPPVALLTTNLREA